MGILALSEKAALRVLVLVWFPDEAMEHVPHALAPAPKGEGCVDEWWDVQTNARKRGKESGLWKIEVAKAFWLSVCSIRWVMDSWVGNYPFGPNSVIDLGHQFLKLNGPFFLLLVGVVWLGLRPWSYTRHDVSLVLGLSPAQVCLVGDLSWTSPWRHVNDRFCSVDPTIGYFCAALNRNHWSNIRLWHDILLFCLIRKCGRINCDFSQTLIIE